jgi:hypothetical protein
MYGVAVSMSDDTERLCRRLATDPQKLFEKPFLGYALILLTGSEDALLNKTLSQIYALDALSGDTFAYLIVIKKCVLPLQVLVADRGTPLQLNVIELPELVRMSAFSCL